MPRELLAPWFAQVNDFRDPFLVTWSGPVAVIDVRAQDIFSLQQQTNSTWRVLPQDLPADAGLVRELLSALSGLQIVEFTNDVVTAADLPAYGLASPAQQYVLRSPAVNTPAGPTNAILVEVDFGTNQADKVFARRPDENCVYAVKFADFQRLPSISWEMRERRIWDYSTNDIASVTIQQAGRVRQVMRKGANDWSLAPGSQGVINVLGVEEAVRGLCQLAAVAWMARGDESRARYGFAENGPRLTLELKNGEQGVGRVQRPGLPQFAVCSGHAGRAALDFSVSDLALRLRAEIPFGAFQALKAEFPKAPRPRRGFWRTCRVYFRRFRITVWLLILGLLGAVIYVTQIGLPDFAKKPLLENLRARGLDLQFSRLRLTWQHGIVAEKVRFGSTGEPFSPELTAGLVQLRLNHHALARLRLHIDGLVLRQGRLAWLVSNTNETPRQLTVDNIQAELRFFPDDEWVLDHFTAGFAGARIQLSGTLVHASAVRDWKMPEAEQAAAPGALRNRLRRFEETLSRIQFSTPPVLRLDLRGDARNLASLGVRVLVHTPGADTPWGMVHQGRFSARVFPATTNGLSRAELSLDAGEARTRWGTTSNLQLTARLDAFESLTNLGNGDLTLCAGRIETEWGRATNVEVDGARRRVGGSNEPDSRGPVGPGRIPGDEMG